MSAAFSTYVFDAYGTLFDVHSAVARHRDAVGPEADRMSALWRAKQLEYTWVRSLIGGKPGTWRDFEDVTADALDFATEACNVRMGARLRVDLLNAYRRLDAYPDVLPALNELQARGAKLAILSNGTEDMLAEAVEAAGLDDLIDMVLSVDESRIFKTAPEVYDLVGPHLGVMPDEVSFQSSNRWDVAGAAAYGFSPVWINRTGQPDEYDDLPPRLIARSLLDLVEA